MSTTGGGFIGVFAGSSRIGVEEPDKVRKFQVARLESPVSWDLDSLVIDGGEIPKESKKVSPKQKAPEGYNDRK